jgi:hypothetical protein
MDDILNEINKKNSQYQRAAINRAKFLLTGNEDIRGQLKELLIGLNERISDEKMDLAGIYEINFMNEMIRLYSSSFIDETSLYLPVEGKKEFVPGTMEVDEPDLQLRNEKMRKMAEKMQKMLTPAKINRYIEEQLGGRSSMKASELPMAQIEDFIKVIYTRLYGQRKNMKYRIERRELIKVGDFAFQDYEIWRK